MARRLFLRTRGATDWCRELARRERHWKRGYSAFELAVAWESASHRADGLPPQIAGLLGQVPQLAGATMLFGVVEHKVPLPGGSRPSSSDMWAFLRAQHGLISMAIEGKARESFGETLNKWRSKAPEGSRKEERLRELIKTLALPEQLLENLRYQLLHRAASAVLEAERWHASFAVMIVQAFATDVQSFDEFSLFASLLGAQARREALVSANAIRGVPLFLGWVTCRVASDAEVARAVVRQGDTIHKEKMPTVRQS